MMMTKQEMISIKWGKTLEIGRKEREKGWEVNNNFNID